MIDILELRRHMTISHSGGVLNVTGTTGAETMYAHWYITSYSYPNLTYQLIVSDGTTTQPFNFPNPGNNFTKISIYGGNGNDTIYAAYRNPQEDTRNVDTNFLPVTVNGGAGSDTLYGPAAKDNILEIQPSATIQGGSGGDYINAQGYSDSVDAGDGDDLIVTDWEPGGSHPDTITGGTGADAFFYDSTDILTDYSSAAGDTLYLDDNPFL